MTRDTISQLIEEAARKKTVFLNLSLKDLSSLPPEIGNLTNLTTLQLTSNRLTSLPREIGNLTNLTTLQLTSNQLISLPCEIGNLTNLKELYLSENKLTSLPPEIGNLTDLKELYLYGNKLTSLPPEIGNLINLTTLYLSGNELSSLPPEIGNLTNLRSLYLYGNKLTSLPPEIGNLKNLEEYDLETPPIEIIKKGAEAIKKYLESFEGEKKTAINEIKVLLVGDGGAGKTSLVKQLLEKEFDETEPLTHGINIKQWEIKEGEIKIKVNFWDFGGQEIMHATHQFFLSRRSLYILVLDGRKEEKTEYWLKHIESLGGNSPVLVVLNKIDETPSFDLNRKFLQEKYPSIKGFYRVSCKKGFGIKDFRKYLSEELTKIEIIHQTWPTSWFNIKTQLEKLSEDFINDKKYKEICKKERIDEPAQEILVDFLHDLGTILHFKDFSLSDTYILKPEWMTEALYKIINSEEVAKTKGVLRLNSLHEILNQDVYPPHKYVYIIDLMKKFELCYMIDEKTILIPDLLDVWEPKFDFDYTNSLKYIIEYDFLPKSIMPRFIVKRHKEILNDLKWRTGVVLEDRAYNSIAVIKSDDYAKKIKIYVDGEKKREYFATIRNTFRDINNSFKKLKTIELVPLPDNDEITIAYKQLLLFEKMGQKYIHTEKKDYNVKQLLDRIEKRQIGCLLLTPNIPIHQLIADVLLENGIELIFVEESAEAPLIEAEQQAIEHADLIIADLTGTSPNIMYEVGFAHALRKPILIIVQHKEHQVPSSMSGFLYLVYDPLKLDETRRIIQTWIIRFLKTQKLTNKTRMSLHYAGDEEALG